MKYNEKLRLFAKEKYGGITKLAEALGIAQQSLSRYLSGEVKPGLDLIIKLKELGCDINWLLSEDDKPPPVTTEILEARIKELEEENERLRNSIRQISLLTETLQVSQALRRRKKK